MCLYRQCQIVFSRRSRPNGASHQDGALVYGSSRAADRLERQLLPREPPLQPPLPSAESGHAKREVLQRRELTADAREEAVERREQAVLQNATVASERESSLTAREEAARLREDTLHAREDAAQARLELGQLNAQLQEANERLVVATLKAQGAEEDAERANRLKDEFLATVSHELRTPLSAVLGWARILASQELTKERAARAVETIERNATALVHLIDDLLDVSGIFAGTLRLESQPIDLIALSQTALDAVKPLALDKRIALQLSADPSTSEVVNGDAARLEQVIGNLLANAIKFTSEGGRINVSVEHAESFMAVKVTDTGQGIPADFLPHVFDRFRQADGATSRRHGGLGLGLAIVRQLVERHGGTVHAESPGPGRGATFTVCLPIPEPSAPVAPMFGPRERRSADSSASPLTGLQRLDELRILVVDDTEDGRSLTSLVLTQAGASVETVATARDAIHVLERQGASALVTDIGLPDEDGYQLLGEIRRHEAEHGGFLPAIALTGFARDEDRRRVLAAGFQAHVAKPVDPAELIATIIAVMRDDADAKLGPTKG